MVFKNSIIYLFLIINFSCATSLNNNYEKVSTYNLYEQTNIGKYLLESTPNWMNSSYNADCFRKKEIKYLNLKNVMNSFSLSYKKSLQLQYLFNILLIKASKIKEDSLSFREIERLFLKGIGEIKNNQFIFKAPSYKRVNIIWLDSYINDLSSFRSLQKSDEMNLGRPLFLTMCKNRDELFTFLKENNISIAGIRVISYEMFSRYSQKGELQTDEILELDYLFKKEQEIYLYSNRKRPSNIKGKYHLKLKTRRK